MSASRRVTMATLNARRRRSQEKALIGVFELADGYELSVWRSPLTLDAEPPTVRVTWPGGSVWVTVEALLLVAPELRHYRRSELSAVFTAAMDACEDEEIHGVRLKLFRKLLDGEPR